MAEITAEKLDNFTVARMRFNGEDGVFIRDDRLAELLFLARIGIKAEKSRQYFSAEDAGCPVCRGDTRICAQTPAHHCGGES
jgi:hypothetical protein